MAATASIGQSIQIKGELTGNEDLAIEGMVEGKIVLKDHHLVIGATGKVMAEIHAKSIVITGEVQGNIVAGERLEIRDTGRLRGDIVTPRLVIVDGARFKGSVDMDLGSDVPAKERQARAPVPEPPRGSLEKAMVP